MSDFLSPIDPIFFLHHSNIDRMWDVWTRKQQALDPQDPSRPIQYPTTPTGADLTTWNSERFLFFVEPDGKPAAKQTSGDYVLVDAFNYEYEPGSGEDAVPSVATTPSLLAFKSFPATINASIAFQQSAGGQVDLPADLLQAVAANAVRLSA
jgi:hypothetical protein